MSFSKPNASSATLTRNRGGRAPGSGMCVVCVDGCTGFCEIGKSALRGREVIYPQEFGKVIAGSEKDYPVDLSHFNIQGTCVGAVGVKADSDKAIFPVVDITTEVGSKKEIKLKVPFFTGALGSTEIARLHWESMAIGAAICGTIVIVGENVCGMDPQSEIEHGRI
ncbi:MAG TPA: FMN-binding glutamate synthase family protein, partial [Candidatus Aerophobetes bacterium]|nr:FMN-binding glutamate synthase family protein [Candidatus Aerophobetes bacterium]